MSQAEFVLQGRNPDVLTCIANLSNDEVFTPPELANRMLDGLTEAWAAHNDGANIWADKNVRFLDPFTKSGVFLREITKRLVDGLADDIPDLGKRVDHILTEQVFGIAITELTALLARRSVYCSKYADGKHSIAKSFDTPSGNIWFERTEHTWDGGKCKFCSAPKAIFDRSTDLETYAYDFIHATDPKNRLTQLFGVKMKFDVVVGNPPYQMTGGAGGSSDSSIYHLFVEQAIRLEPRLLSMVIPSRWLAGGRGLDDFRTTMLNSRRLLRLVDHPVSKEVFPGVEVKGGICYFLWSNTHDGTCKVSVVRGDESSTTERRLDEFDVFVRDPRAVAILRKVLKLKEPAITEILTADTPFGIATNFDGFRTTAQKGDVALYFVRSGKRDTGFIPRSLVEKNASLLDKWKVLAPKAGSDGGQRIPDSVLGKPWMCPPPAACTQTFLAFHVDNEAQAASLMSYYETKFFRHLVSLRKLTQDALRPMYGWVPQQTWDRKWTDDELNQKYQLSAAEISYIESVVKPMGLGDESID